MSSRARWLAVAALVVVALVILLTWRGCRPAPPAPPPIESFAGQKVPVVSPELAVGVAVVRGMVRPDSTDWTCLLECREPEGCHAVVQLLVDYWSQGERRQLRLDGRLDAAMGETMRIGRVQRPPVAVDRVEGMTVEVVRPFRRGDPTPTEVE